MQYPFSPRTHTQKGLTNHSKANTEIKQIVNVHEIPPNVHEMFKIYPLKTHFHERH